MRIAFALAAMTALAACNVRINVDGQSDGLPGSGVEATELRDVGAFTRVRIDGAGTLELSTGALTPLTLTGDDNILPLIDTTVEDSLLVIRPSRSISPERGLVFRATVPELTGVECAGAAEIVVRGLDAQSFAIGVRGSALVEATGRAASLTIDLSGAGSVDTLGLIARDVRVDMSGAGSASVHADATLAVSISGIGRVTYDGDAEIVEKNISGLGVVTRR